MNLNKVITHWPDMLRVVGSPVTGHVRAYDLLRMFGREGRPTPLHANLNVLGRYRFRASTPVDGGLRPLRDPGAGGLDEDEEE